MGFPEVDFDTLRDALECCDFSIADSRLEMIDHGRREHRAKDRDDRDDADKLEKGKPSVRQTERMRRVT